MLTEDIIADFAERAAFYVTEAGLWLRVDYCDMDDGWFQAHDEDSGEEYRFDFADLVAVGKMPRFFELVEIKVDSSQQ